jgi:hypothetical protein
MSKTRTQTVPLLPPDHPHTKGRVLGERQHNAQSPPVSPSKSRTRNIVGSKTSHDLRSPTKDTAQRGINTTNKSRSSTNLSGMFARMNRSNKDLSSQAPKDKENTTPPSSSDGRQPVETPIWAQYASSAKLRPNSREGIEKLEREIARYTPKAYSPSKQRNFNGDFDQPQLRPTLSNRPQSMYVMGSGLAEAVGGRVSMDRMSMTGQGRKSVDLERRRSRDQANTATGLKVAPDQRKTSGSSTEQAPLKEKLTIAKRGAGEKVMAAVAAFQGKGGTKGHDNSTPKEPVLDEKAVDKAFEAVLASRNVPEPMRQKMRSLTMRVKADFIKQDQEASKAAGSTPPGTAGSMNSIEANASETTAPAPCADKDEEDTKATKRSRPRSRTFTFSKSEKRTNDASPSKKHRSRSKSRDPSTTRVPTTPTTPRASMDKKRSSIPAVPADYITYLRTNKDPVSMEVGRLHKLRILLRNETVAWVDGFLSLGGMPEIVALLHRILGIEWREEHEDQLLHETLLCLKGLCTTERAMGELEQVADGLFPALISMLFDDEKKGPAEYTTRGIVITVLCKCITVGNLEAALT